jgi:hypothetical protein
MITNLREYDAKRTEARSLGKRKVVCIVPFDCRRTDLRESLIEYIENIYWPRDGKPEIKEISLYNTEIMRDKSGEPITVFLYLKVVALINRYVYFNSPQEDFIDRIGVEE